MHEIFYKPQLIVANKNVGELLLNYVYLLLLKYTTEKRGHRPQQFKNTYIIIMIRRQSPNHYYATNKLVTLSKYDESIWDKA